MTTSGTNPAIARTPTVAAPSLSTLVNFAGGNGSNPIAGLIADTAGDLFGTTQEGGAANNGTVFEIVNTATGYAAAPNHSCQL